MDATTAFVRTERRDDKACEENRVPPGACSPSAACFGVVHPNRAAVLQMEVVGSPLAPSISAHKGRSSIVVILEALRGSHQKLFRLFDLHSFRADNLAATRDFFNRSKSGHACSPNAAMALSGHLGLNLWADTCSWWLAPTTNLSTIPWRTLILWFLRFLFLRSLL